MSMEFEEDKNSFAGTSSTIFGAIFMSNHVTKRECFKRKLFGLPSSQSGLVTKLKAGMVLFLFEYEERKLYGVFQASSDGAMNIVPNAFRSSGKKVPAQILFKTIWCCQPLSEHDFRDAIKDNYFTSNKFNLGLNEDQVSKLLWLFNSRKVKMQRTLNLLSRENVKRHSKKSYISRVSVRHEDRFLTTGSIENKTSIDDEPVNLTKYSDLCRSNLNFSDASQKHILETDNSIVEAPPRLSLAASPSVETRISKRPRLTPCNDICDECTNPRNLYHSNTSSFSFGSSPSLGINDQSFTPEFVTYSKNSMDPLYPIASGQLTSSNAEPESLKTSPSGHPSLSGTRSSRENLFSFSRSQQLTLFHTESENLNTSQIRCGFPNVTASLGDYVPLTGQDHFEWKNPSIPSSEIETFRNKRLDYVNLEYNRSLSFSESSLSKITLAMLENFRQGTSSSDAFIPGNGSSHLSEHGHPTVSTGCSNYEFEGATISSSDAGQFHFQVGDSQSEDLHERTGLESPNNWDNVDSETPAGLYFGDVGKKRLSVFSRLAMTQESARQDNDYYGYEHMSVNQVMGILYQKQSYWRKNSRRYKHVTEQHEEGNSFKDIQQVKMSSDPVAATKEDEKSIERIEIPLINFKRRSKSQKIQGGESEGKPVTAPKRRRLVRPSFATTEEPACAADVIGAAGYNKHESFQEICEKGTGSDTNLVSTDGNDSNERKSQNINAQNANVPVGCEHGNTKRENGSRSEDFRVEKEASQDGIDNKDCFLNLRGSTHENVIVEQGSNTKDFKAVHVNQELGSIRDCSDDVLDSSPDIALACLTDDNKAEERAGDALELAGVSLKSLCNEKGGVSPIKPNCDYIKRYDDNKLEEQKDVAIEEVDMRDCPLNILDSSLNEPTCKGDINKYGEGSGAATLQGPDEIASEKSEVNWVANGFSLELSLSPTNLDVLKIRDNVAQKDASREAESRKTANGGMIDLNMMPEN